MLTRLTRVSCPCGTVEGGERAAPRRSRRFLAAVIAALGVGAAAPSIGEAKRSPALRAHGEVLEWTRAGRHNKYRLVMKIRGRHVRGRRTVITVVGHSFKPPVVPGATVVYRVSHPSIRVDDAASAYL